MASKRAEKPVTEDDRLKALESKVAKYEAWLGVLSVIAVALGITGASLMARAKQLSENYVKLESSYSELSKRAESLEKDLTVNAKAILEREAPNALAAASSQLVRYNDVIYLKTRAGRLLGVDDGVGTPNTGGPNGRGKGQDERFVLER
jgi:hypothetical protein